MGERKMCLLKVLGAGICELVPHLTVPLNRNKKTSVNHILYFSRTLNTLPHRPRFSYTFIMACRTEPSPFSLSGGRNL